MTDLDNTMTKSNPLKRAHDHDDDNDENFHQDSRQKVASLSLSSNDENRQKRCFICAEITKNSSSHKSFKIKNIKEQVLFCDGCRDDAVEFFVEMEELPKRVFFAKPLSIRKSKEYREVFDNVEDFQNWCESEMDQDIPYVFGITITNKQPESKHIQKWLKGGPEPSSGGKIFWTNDPKEDWEDPEDWEKLVEMYKEGDCNFSHINDPDVVWKMDIPKFFEFVKSKQKELMTNISQAFAFTLEQEQSSTCE